jgi:hypothetical protein
MHRVWYGFHWHPHEVRPLQANTKDVPVRLRLLGREEQVLSVPRDREDLSRLRQQWSQRGPAVWAVLVGRDRY